MINTEYEDLLAKVVAQGVIKEDRTGTGTLSLFAQSMRFNLAEGFPLVTSKTVNFGAVVAELLWFLSGSTNIEDLHPTKIWDEWAREDGDLGPIYGALWRTWAGPDGESIDQISRVIESIRTDPDSRRHIVTAWNPGLLPQQALPPCHILFQFYVADGKLSCHLYQRSADMFLGVPFNIASYALLTHMVAAQTGLEVGEFVWTGGDVHIYANHLRQVTEQLGRRPRPFPTLQLNRRDSIFDYRIDDAQVIDYDPWPPLRGKVSV